MKTTALPFSCEQCGKTFQRSPRRSRKTKINFCSRLCYIRYIKRNNIVEHQRYRKSPIKPIPIQCHKCGISFLRHPRHIRKQNFCSKECHNKALGPVACSCEQCHKLFLKQQSQIKKTKHNFCCKTCACIYYNAHKTKGTRASKLEKWLAIKLPELYPNLEFHFNRKDAINGELDIFIPSLKLAFELNGIFHYEPIYGSDKLTSTQTNDCRKMLACAEYGISLCVIDVSHQLYFKEQTSMKFLQIIQNIINAKLSGSLPVIATVA